MNDIQLLRQSFFDYGIDKKFVQILITLILNEHISWKKPRCLLISGASGVGKTYLARLINEIANKTMVTIDSKTLSEVGYSGKDPSTIFEEIFRAASGNLNEAERGIIHLDEFDKLATHTDREKDINGIGIQQSLLKPLDGFTINFTVQDISKLRPVTSINLKTDNLIFIFTGSFNGTKISSPEDLIKANFLPELAYRIDFYLHLEKPNYKELLSSIHSEGLLEEATAFAAKYGLNISFKDNFEKKLAQFALQKEGNYRAVKFIFNNIIYYKIIELISLNSHSYHFTENDLL